MANVSSTSEDWFLEFETVKQHFAYMQHGEDPEIAFPDPGREQFAAKPLEASKPRNIRLSHGFLYEG